MLQLTKEEALSDVPCGYLVSLCPVSCSLFIYFSNECMKTVIDRPCFLLCAAVFICLKSPLPVLSCVN